MSKEPTHRMTIAEGRAFLKAAAVNPCAGCADGKPCLTTVDPKSGKTIVWTCQSAIAPNAGMSRK